MPLLKSPTVCPLLERNFHFVVKSPSIPTGPLAWILPVLIPTSAPSDICYYPLNYGTLEYLVQICSHQQSECYNCEKHMHYPLDSRTCPLHPTQDKNKHQ